jgi:hypothetical protein
MLVADTSHPRKWMGFRGGNRGHGKKILDSANLSLTIASLLGGRGRPGNRRLGRDQRQPYTFKLDVSSGARA